MLRGWRRTIAENGHHSMDAQTEAHNLDVAAAATLRIMSDDLEGAESALGDGVSTFHKLGKGMVGFLRSTLGFEQDIMREATERLNDGESAASSDYRRAQHDSQAFRSSIYAPGAEYALCQAEMQMMAAVIGVLNESLSESLKGFYKIRKAFQTLESIIAAEAKYQQRRQDTRGGNSANRSTDSFNLPRPATPAMPNGIPGGWSSAPSSRPASRQGHEALERRDRAKAPTQLSRIETGVELEQNQGAEDDEDEFFDADEDHSERPNDNYQGTIEINGLTQRVRSATLQNEGNQKPFTRGKPPDEHGLIDQDPDSDIFSNPIDVFIHSGANMCFGMLNLMISMIPPAFGRLLLIIGFHGDRAKGIRMLWQASKFHNINGAMAGLIVLGYYNTIVGFSDIFPESETHVPPQEQIEGYPKERCEALLQDMRRRHPESHLWLMEEARLNAFNKRLSTAISVLEDSPASKFKQVEALKVFEKSLDSMYSHRYELCATSFLACLGLNNWSHTLYLYIAGSAHVELYRIHQTSDPAAAEKHARKATELLREAPQHAGKKKFMARQLPFDVFVMRKIKKWEARVHDLGCKFIDAVGVSPVEEMIFFWNGYKRMDIPQLRDSLDRLAWSTSRPAWRNETHDEHALEGVLRAATLRNLNRLDEAETVLQQEVLSFDKSELKGELRDDWTAPAAHYEMAVICWNRRQKLAAEGQQGVEKQERWVRECEGWIGKAAKWESYELDARIGVKVATAQDTLKRWREGAEGARA